MPFFIYVIKNSSNNKTYTGQTDNLEKRILRHNNKLPNKSKSFSHKNKSDGKWKLLYFEECTTRQESIKREKELKSYQGRQFIKRIAQSIDSPAGELLSDKVR